MWWFRWSSLVTVLAGFAYWNRIVGVDAQNAIAAGETASAGRVIGSFVLIWTIAFAVQMGLLMSPAEVLRKGAVFGVIMAVVIVGAAYVFLALNEQGWESNRALAIGIGGGIGWFMMLSVWGIVWRMQKKIIRWTGESAAKGTAMPAGSGQGRPTELSERAAELLAVVSHAVLHGSGQPLHHVCGEITSLRRL